MTVYKIPDGPKMLRETLCVAQAHVGNSTDPRKAEHVARLGRLIAECDRYRPIGGDGKHGNRHTPGCEPADTAEPTPCPDGFRWIGQPFWSCDGCGLPAWDHVGMNQADGPAWSGRLTPWKPGEAAAIRVRWETSMYAARASRCR